MTRNFRPSVLLTTYYNRDVIKESLDRLSKIAEIVDAGRGRRLTREELLESLSGIHVTIAADEQYTAEIMDAAPDLVLIAREGAGYDSIDLEAATQRGILAVNAPVVQH